MDVNLSVFQEPRGVMRIFQFVFSICAFATTTSYTGFVNFNCKEQYEYTYDYPFNLNLIQQKLINTASENITCDIRVTINGDFSSDARFFVATGVLAMLYTIFIVILYVKFDTLYKNNNQVPLIDFILSLILAVLWLSSSAAWANGLNGLKHLTDPKNIEWRNVSTTCPMCDVFISSFSTLDISVILGFLNFFLWASGLWFLYKETTWFQNAPPSSVDGI